MSWTHASLTPWFDYLEGGGEGNLRSQLDAATGLMRALGKSLPALGLSFPICKMELKQPHSSASPWEMHGGRAAILCISSA